MGKVRQEKASDLFKEIMSSFLFIIMYHSLKQRETFSVHFTNKLEALLCESVKSTPKSSPFLRESSSCLPSFLLWSDSPWGEPGPATHACRAVASSVVLLHKENLQTKEKDSSWIKPFWKIPL